MGEGLVDGQADAGEARDLHDGFAPIVVDCVVAGVAHHLVQVDDGLVRNVAPCEVVLVQRNLNEFWLANSVVHCSLRLKRTC